MRNELGHFTLGEHATFRNGLNFSKDSRGKGCLLIGVPDFQSRFSPDYESLSQINPKGIAKADDYLKKDDIVFVRSNGNKALVGRSLYIDKDVEALFSGFCIRARLTSTEINKLFFAYFTRSTNFKSQIASSSGTNINNLSQEILSRVRLPAFKKKDQEKIAAVLSVIDAKIDCNNRINAELEAMAKTLYDYWFVQFDFPDANGKPYKSSGGKMVYNATLKREIPAGWKNSTIGETFRSHLGGTPSRDIDEYWSPGEVNWLSSGENPSTFVVAPDEKISTLGLQNSPAKLLPRGTVILSIVRHLRVSILGIEAATNQSVVGIVETAKLKHCFIYPYLVREIPRLMALRTGAQQPHINKGVLDESPLLIPADGPLNTYTSTAEPLFLQIQKNLQQNVELAQLRDWLLPLLMNGQVTVA
ncbi:type I restriction enzyme S subunit [Acidovorax sp. 93]|uniref:restriction endonuclease subunit S n=1 Tax=Acidovorax sp. 93 TaxID=2135632 RepID=UPI000EB5DA2A|nr:restriction endonuclease subunit S [Acidovorax sp. 93]RKR28154.1 type I restriction enzyme S subunit [Acidovorax sp. 93]